MVSFLQQFRTAESGNLDGYQLILNEEQSNIIDMAEHAPSFTSGQFSVSSPRRQAAMNFDQMLTYINNISFSDLNGWSSSKIMLFNKYLLDRIQNSTAYRGYFTCFLQIIEVVVEYMNDLSRNGQRLVRGQKRHDLVMALLCVQALNKAYGRRSDVRSSCHILTAKVAGDFTSVATLLQQAIQSIDSNIETPRMNFVVPGDNRRLFSTLQEYCAIPQTDKQSGVLNILQQYSLKPKDFTDSDFEWFENEYFGAQQENMMQMVSMLGWIMHAVRPNYFPQPRV